VNLDFRIVDSVSKKLTESRVSTDVLVFGGGSPSDRLAVEFPSGTPRWIGLVVTKRGAVREIYQESGKRIGQSLESAVRVA